MSPCNTPRLIRNSSVFACFPSFSIRHSYFVKADAYSYTALTMARSHFVGSPRPGQSTIEELMAHQVESSRRVCSQQN